MSYSTITSTAPWKSLFAQHLEHFGGAGPEFALATVTNSGLPRVRMCIHRGFFASLPENLHNELPKNPPTYDTDCPTFTTDARMNKVFDIFSTSNGQGDLHQSRLGTGGGGSIEAVYWVKDVMTQWRIRGKCWLLAADDVEEDNEAAQNLGTLSMKAEVGRYMRPAGGHEDNEKGWSWKREVENHFENLSPIMRGTFKNPRPGKPIIEGVELPGEALGQIGGHLRDEDLARRNFRVGIITPEQVEQVDLSDPLNCKRRFWALAETGGTQGNEGSSPVKHWNVVESWP